MGRIVVTENVSLDGVMQAPGSPDEDTSGGFEHGGWAGRYNDPVLAQEMGQGMASTGAMLFGRRTYERFHAYWHGRTDGNPFTPHLDAATKYVVSDTLAEPLPWEGSTLVRDGMAGVATLRDGMDGDLAVIGSGALVRSLEAAGLVDEYTLLVHPLLLGSGTRLFAAESPKRPMRLVRSRTTSTGVIMAVYEPEEAR